MIPNCYLRPYGYMLWFLIGYIITSAVNLLPPYNEVLFVNGFIAVKASFVITLSSLFSSMGVIGLIFLLRNAINCQG